MTGLLSGNPYYSGPSAGAAGVNAFADNLMKGYQFFNDMDRQKQQAAMQQQLQQAKLNEYENEQKMRAEMAAYNQPRGLMAQASPAMPQLQEPGVMGQGAMGPAMPTPGMGGMGTPAIQADPSIQGIPEAAAAPQSEEEYLKGAYAIISKYNPEKALMLREQLYAAKSKAEMNQALMEIRQSAQEAKNDYMNKVMDFKTSQLSQKEDSLKETSRHNMMVEALRARGGGEGGGKTTEFDRDYADYLAWHKQNPTPGTKAFSRGEYRDYQTRQGAASKKAGEMEGLTQGIKSPSSGGGKQLNYNPKTGRME